MELPVEIRAQRIQEWFVGHVHILAFHICGGQVLIMQTESQMPDSWKKYTHFWNSKTIKQVEKELASMRKFVQKNSSHYSWHGANTPPGGLADGDKILILCEILRSRTLQPPAGSP